MKMRRAGWCGLAMVVGLLVAAAPGRSDEATLPEGVALYMRTAPMEKTLTDLDAFVGALVRGTPVQMFAPPGVVRMQLVEATGIPLETFDLEKGAHIFFLINPEDIDEAPTPVLLLPVADYAATLERLGDFGMEVEVEEDGTHRVMIGFNTALVSDTGKGYAMVAEDADALALGQATLANWTIPGTLEGAHLETTYNIEGLYGAGGEQLREGVAEILKSLEELDVEGLDAKAMLKPTMDLVLQLAEETRTLRCRMHLSPERITTTYDMIAKPGSKMATFFNQHTDNPLPMDLYTLLPADGSITGLMSHQPEVVAWIHPKLHAYLQESIKPFDEEVAVFVADAYGLMLKHNGATVMSSSFLETGASESVTLIRTPDAEGLRQAYGQLYTAVNTFVQRVFAKVQELTDEEIPLTMAMKVVPNAGEIEGVSYDTLHFEMEVDEEKLAAMSEEERRLLRNQLETMEKSMQARMTAMGDLFLVAQGADEATMMTDMIQALRGKTVRLGANKTVMQAVNRHVDGSCAIFTMDLIPILKAGAVDALNKMPHLNSKGVDAMRMMLKALQGEGIPFVMAVRPGTDAMHMTIEMPVGEINTLITTVAQMATTWMMVAQPQIQMEEDVIQDFDEDDEFEVEEDGLNQL